MKFQINETHFLCVCGQMLACLYLDEGVVDLCVSMYINFASKRNLFLFSKGKIYKEILNSTY